MVCLGGDPRKPCGSLVVKLDQNKLFTGCSSGQCCGHLGLIPTCGH